MMLNEGKLPEAHPRFGGRWLRDYFLADSVPLRPLPISVPNRLASPNGVKVLGSTQIVVGVILFHTEREELAHLFASLRKAVEQAQAEGTCPRWLFLRTTPMNGIRRMLRSSQIVHD